MLRIAVFVNAARMKLLHRGARARDCVVCGLVVSWEMTLAFDLKCMHGRASAQPHRHALELSAAEAFNLVDQVANMRVPMFVLTGGDPLKRPDLQAIVQYARQRSVKTSLTPSATPLFTFAQDSSTPEQSSSLPVREQPGRGRSHPEQRYLRLRTIVCSSLGRASSRGTQDCHTPRRELRVSFRRPLRSIREHQPRPARQSWHQYRIA